MHFLLGQTYIAYVIECKQNIFLIDHMGTIMWKKIIKLMMNFKNGNNSTIFLKGNIKYCKCYYNSKLLLGCSKYKYLYKN